MNYFCLELVKFAKDIKIYFFHLKIFRDGNNFDCRFSILSFALVYFFLANLDKKRRTMRKSVF